jgi:YVTN family beta-propeller protein
MLKSLAFATFAAAIAVAAPAQTVKATIPTAQPTAGLAANPFTNKIYVAAPTFGGSTDAILVIDGKTDNIIKQIPVPVGAANFVVVDILRNLVYAVGCDNFSPTFSCLGTEINGKTDTVVASQTILTHPGDGILGVAFDPVCRKLYVANGSDYRVDVVDMVTGKTVENINTSNQEPFGIAFNPVDQRLYIPFVTGQAEVYDVRRHTRIADVTVGDTNIFAAANLVTGHVFVTNDDLGTATTLVLDKDGKILAEIPVQDNPYGVDVDPITDKVYVANTGTGNLTVIDGKTNTVTTALSGVNANYVAVNYGSRKVYLSGNTGITVVTE